MNNLIKQPYEISIWEDQIAIDTNNKRYFKENLIAVIGSNTMDTPVRVFNPTLSQNINGTSVLSFSIFSSYYDEITDSMILNPFTSLLVNERKIKLKYGKNQDNEDQWYDFVIKNIQEDSSQNIFIYTAYDLHIEELSKTGFKIELNSELGNNQGTITDLADTIIEGTDWEILPSGSDIIRQTVSEPLYEVTLNRAINAHDMLTNELVSIDSGKVIYVSYHSINERDPYFQFFYRADGAYEIDDDRNLLNAPAGSNYYLENVTYNEEEGPYGPIPTLTNGAPPVSENFRGKRLVREQSITYDPTIDKYVKVYKDSQNREVYGLEETEYLTVTTIQNFVSNSEDFEGTNGWSVNPNDSISDVIYPKATAANIANNALHDYLKVNFSSGSAGLIHNTGFKDNRNKIHDLTLGEKYVFRIKYGIGSTPTATNFSGNRLNAKILPYSIDGNGNFVLDQANSYIDFNGTGSNFVIEAAAGAIGYYHIIGTVSKSLSYSDLINTKIGLFLYSTASSPSTVTYWIEDVQLFKHRLNSNNGIVFPGDVPESKISTTYKYYYPNENYKSIDDISFIYNNIIPSPNFSNNYDPNFQKIRSITASESNRYNLIQSLCETFECWAKFYIERNPATGEILRDEATGRLKKWISFHEYVGKDNDAGFKYGINLLSINRQLSSEQIVTKLIVKNNANQFGKDGFTSIARASENPIKENFLLNFKHPIQQGLLNFAEFNNDLYGLETAGWIGYYKELRRINKNNSKIIEEVSKQKIEVSKLESNIQTYTLARNTASEKIAASKAELKSYTGYTYQNFLDGIPATTKWIENNAVKKIIETIKNNTRTFEKYQPLVLAYESYLESLNQAIIANEDILKDYVAEKQALDDKFYNKYYTFIKEGSWISEDYVDDNLYFLDAQSVLYDSASPQVSYTINVIDLSALPEYENYKFDLGDKTYVEHTEFFGWFINSLGQKTPYKEEVIVSQVVYNLDNPEQNQISVQNYKTQFEDLFQRITATVQSVQYRTGAYERVTNVIDTNGNINPKTLQNSLTYNQFIISNASDQSVIWDETGITVTNLRKPNEILRLVSGGILLTTDGGLNWNYGVTGGGINADFITAGQIDTSRINIMGGGSSAFRWDHTGLNAYSFERDENLVPQFYDTTKFIRFDQYGIYAYNGEDTFLPNQEEDIRSAAGTKFALTRRGFFLRSTKVDGGYLLLDSEKDFVVNDGSVDGGVDRVKIGLLDNGAYGLQLKNAGGDVVLESSDTGSLFLRELLSIGPDSYTPRTQLGVIDTDENGVSKIFAINNKNEEEQLAMFDDGRIVAKSIEITGNSKIGNMTINQYEQSIEEFLLKSETTTVFKVTPAQGSNPEIVVPSSINLFVDYKNININPALIEWRWTTDYITWNPIQKNNEDHTGETLSLTYAELSSRLDISDLVAIRAYVPNTTYSSFINLTRIKDGIIGQDGVSVESSTIEYQKHNSGVTPPLTWSATILEPTTADPYLWTRVTISYTGEDVENTILYTVTKKGEEGNSITNIQEWYLASADSTGVTKDTYGWSETMSTISANLPFLWNYTKFTFASGNPKETDPIVVGHYGTVGEAGEAGRGISSIAHYYKITNDNSQIPNHNNDIGWSTTPPITTPTDRFLWGYQKIVYTTLSPEGGNEFFRTPVSIISTHGASGTSSYTHIRYSNSSNGDPMVEDPAGMAYLGLAYTNFADAPTTPEDYNWSLIKGSDGISATTAILLNENQSIVTKSDRLVNGVQTITIPFTAFLGSSKIAATATIGTRPSGITVSSNNPGTTGANGTIILSVANNSNLGGTGTAYDTGTILITVNANGINFPLTFTYSKTIAGNDAYSYYIVGSAETIIHNKNDNSLSPSSLVLNSYYRKGTGAQTARTAYWKIESFDGTSWTTKPVTDDQSNSYTINNISPTDKLIRVTTASDNTFTNIYDTQTYPIITDGLDGINGQRTAVLEVYKWSSTQPNNPPSGSSNYDWTDGTFTLPATYNNWTLVPGLGSSGQTLWVCKTIYTDNDISTSSTVNWAVNSISSVGVNGVDGYRTAVIEMYKWANEIPDLFPSGTSTYTWANGTFTDPAQLNGWSKTIGAASQGQTLYGITQSISNNDTNDTTNITWSGSNVPYVLGYSAIDGKDGEPGAPAKYVKINGDQFFKFDAGASVPTSETILLDVQLFGGLTEYQWKYWNGSVWEDTPLINNELGYDNSIWENNTSLKLRCYSGEYYDEITVVKIYEAQDGLDGLNAFTVFLTNENHTFPATSNGVITAGDYALGATSVRVYSGTTLLTCDSNSTNDPSVNNTYRVTNIAKTGTITIGSSIVGNQYILTPSIMTTSIATLQLTIKAKVNNTISTFVKTLTYSKSLAGAEGIAGPPGTSQYVYIRYSANSNGSSMTTTPQSTTKYIGLANTTSPSAPASYSSYTWSLIQGPQGNQGIQGPAGTTTYTWVKYADTDTGSGMSDTPAGKKYIGLAFNKINPTESEIASDYQWSLMPQNIEIGGRNLVLNSKQLILTSEYIVAEYYISEDFIEGETYTVRIKGTTTSPQVFGLWQNEGSSARGSFVHTGNNIWELTFTSAALVAGKERVVRIYQVPSATKGPATIEEIKLEKGNVATDWTPAPEDVTAKINADVAAARTYAETKATEAQDAAEAVAVAQAALAQTNAEAYADDIVSDEEQARINQAAQNLADAKAHADIKATEAENAAKNYADTQLGTFATAVNGTLDELQNQIDGSITTWFYNVPPTTSNVPASSWTTTELKNIHLGDLYYDIITGYAYRWQVVAGVYSWQRITDSDVTKALEDASKAQDTADSKRRVFTTTPTTPYEVGDLWAQGATGELMRCKTTALTGAYVTSHWEKASKYTDDARAVAAENSAKAHAEAKADAARVAAEAVAVEQANLAKTEAEAYADGIVSDEEQARIDDVNAKLATAKADAATKASAALAAAQTYADTQLTNFATVVNGDINNLQTQVDGKITTWFYAAVPTTVNAPANTWTTKDTKDAHLGDLYYNTSTGQAYRWKVVSATYSWELITDNRITTALANASTAKDVADSKRRVFGSQPTAPYDVNDLWVQGTGGDIMRCITASTATYNAAHWVKAVKYTDDTVANANLAAIGAVDTRVTGLQNFTNTTFADGIVTRAEKESLKTQLQQLHNEKTNIDSRYTTIYNDALLLGTPKNNLLNAKNAYNTAHTNLMTSINTAIADATISAAERVDVENKFTAYRTALSTLSTRFEQAVRAIETQKVDNVQEDVDAAIKDVKSATYRIEEFHSDVMRVTTKDEYNNSIVSFDPADFKVRVYKRINGVDVIQTNDDIDLEFQFLDYVNGMPSWKVFDDLDDFSDGIVSYDSENEFWSFNIGILMSTTLAESTDPASVTKAQNVFKAGHNTFFVAIRIKNENDLLARKGIPVREAYNSDLMSFAQDATKITMAVHNNKLQFSSDGLSVFGAGIWIYKTADEMSDPVFFADKDGNLHLTGILDAASGTFDGTIVAREGIIKKLSVEGELIVGGIQLETHTIEGGTVGTITSPDFIRSEGAEGYQLNSNGTIIANNIILGAQAEVGSYIRFKGKHVGENAFIINPDNFAKIPKADVDAHSILDGDFLLINTEVGGTSQTTLRINSAGRIELGLNGSIILDGVNKKISTNNFTDTSGWSINPDQAVFNNVSVRGSIKASVLEYAETQAVGGILLVRPSSIVKTATKASGANIVITLENRNGFKDGDWCKIQRGQTGLEVDLYEIKLDGIAPIEDQVGIFAGADTGNIILLGTQNVSFDHNELIGKPCINFGQNGSIGIGINSSTNNSLLFPNSLSVFEFRTNLIHQIGYTAGYYLNVSGSVTSSSSWGYTTYIPVVPNTDYTMAGYTNLGTAPSTCFYDQNLSYVDGIAGSARSTVTAPSNAKYVRISFVLTDLPNISFKKVEASASLSTKIILGQIPDREEFGDIKNSYGLYAENVLVKGSLVTYGSYSTGSGTKSVYSGISSNSSYVHSEEDSDNLTNNPLGTYEPILIWAGAQDATRENVIKSNFRVYQDGSFVANKGHFRGSIITDSEIYASELYTTTITGWSDESENKKAALVIRNTNIGIQFYDDENTEKMALTAEDLELKNDLNLTVGGTNRVKIFGTGELIQSPIFSTYKEGSISARVFLTENYLGFGSAGVARDGSLTPFHLASIRYAEVEEVPGIQIMVGSSGDIITSFKEQEITFKKMVTMEANMQLSDKVQYKVIRDTNNDVIGCDIYVR